MKFKFGFENILKTKKIAKDAAHRDYIYAGDEVDKEKNNLNKLGDQINHIRTENMKAVSAEKLTPESIAKLQMADQFMNGQRIKIDRQEKLVEQVTNILVQKQEYLSQIAKEFKIFEKLKERTKERYKKEQRKLEQKNIDELVVMYAKRGQR